YSTRITASPPAFSAGTISAKGFGLESSTRMTIHAGRPPSSRTFPIPWHRTSWKSSRTASSGCPRRSSVGRESQVNLAIARLGPARCHHLAAGVELKGFGAVHVRVAKQGVLPASKRERADRDRDGDIHANHSHFDVELEFASSLSVSREHGGPVGKAMGVNQFDRLVVGIHSHDREHWPENLIGVDAHVRCNPVDERGANEEAFPRGNVYPSIDDDLGAIVDGGFHVAGHPI